MSRSSDTRGAPRARPYNNALREEHAQNTRQRILDTALQLLKEGSPDSFSVPKLAERSGISTPTIYRHFPNRASLFAGLDRMMSERLGRPPLPEGPDGILHIADAAFPFYERGYDLFRVMSSPPLNELAEQGRQKRDESFIASFREAAAGLDARRATALGAAMRVLVSFDAYRAMRERFGVDCATAAEAVTFTVRAVVAAAKELETQAPARTTATITKSPKPKKTTKKSNPENT